MISTKVFPLVLVAAYILRIGDTLVFVFRRTWLYSIMTRSEASKVSAALSSIRRAIRVAGPTITGALALLDPRAPYIACLLLLASTIPVYKMASRKS